MGEHVSFPVYATFQNIYNDKEINYFLIVSIKKIANACNKIILKESHVLSHDIT